MFKINKKLIFLIFSFLSILVLITFSTYELFFVSDGSKGTYGILLIGLILYLLYTLKIYRNDYINAKLDKEEGIEERVLEFLDLTYDKQASYNMKNPTYSTPIATFKLSKKKFISLSGDYSKIKLVKGNRYKVSFYRHSSILVEINEYDKTLRFQRK